MNVSKSPVGHADLEMGLAPMEPDPSQFLPPEVFFWSEIVGLNTGVK